MRRLLSWFFGKLGYMASWPPPPRNGSYWTEEEYAENPGLKEWYTAVKRHRWDHPEFYLKKVKPKAQHTCTACTCGRLEEKAAQS